MHRLSRPTAPLVFTAAVAALLPDYPPAASGNENTRWNALRDQHPAAYKAVSAALEENQDGICAYCEIALRDNNRQVEHFIPKSYTKHDSDLTFDFSNMISCCFGGTNKHSRVPGEFSNDPSAKANHSCGEYRKDKHPADCCLNPYDLPKFPLFRVTLEKYGIGFAPDEKACKRAGINSVLVQNTLDFLNLNCPRLVKKRGAIWEELAKELAVVDALPPEEQAEELQSIAASYLCAEKPAFYTTKLLCLADAMPHLIQ